MSVYVCGVCVVVAEKQLPVMQKHRNSHECSIEINNQLNEMVAERNWLIEHVVHGTHTAHTHTWDMNIVAQFVRITATDNSYRYTEKLIEHILRNEMLGECEICIQKISVHHHGWAYWIDRMIWNKRYLQSTFWYEIHSHCFLDTSSLAS